MGLDGFRVSLGSGGCLGCGGWRWRSRRRVRSRQGDTGRPGRRTQRRMDRGSNSTRRLNIGGLCRHRGRRSSIFGVCSRGFVMSGTILLMGMAVRGACQSLQWRSRTGETPLQFNSDIFIDRAGVRLFLVHAHFGQQIEYDARLHFKFPRQLVDSDLLHRTDCYITPCTTAICI